MSTYLSKSKKDFKPKAPVRRPAAPSSDQPSVRVSTEPLGQSQRQPSQTQLPDASESDSHGPDAGAVSGHDGRTDTAPAQVLPPQNSEAPHQHSAHELSTKENASGAVVQDSQPRYVAIDARTRLPAGAVPIAIPLARRQIPIQEASRNDTSDISMSHSAAATPTEPKTQSSTGTAAQGASKRTASLTEDATEPSPKRRRLKSAKDRRSARNLATDPQLGLEEPQGVADGELRATPTQSTPAAATRRPKSHRRKATRQAPEEEADDPEKSEVKKSKQIARLQKTIAATAEEAGDETPRVQRQSSKRRKRAATPSDPEAVSIAPNDVRMAELCRDTRTGRQSTREARLEKRERDQKAAKARELLRELMGETKESGDCSPDPASAPKSPRSRLDKRSTPLTPVSLMAPQVRIVNGQIVQDEGSRLIDRHAAAENERHDSEEEIQEDELSRRVNSANYIKRVSSFRWTAEATERFYEGLRCFGTDFMMMTAMFPGLQRRHLKLKFAKEERQNEALIKQTLLHERKVVGLEEIQGWTNIVYRDPAEVEKELEEDRRKLEEADRAEREAREQLERERDEEADRKTNKAAKKDAKKDTKTDTETVGKPDGQMGTLEIESESDADPKAESQSRPATGTPGKDRAFEEVNGSSSAGSANKPEKSEGSADPAQRRVTRSGAKALEKSTAPKRTRRSAAPAA